MVQPTHPAASLLRRRMFEDMATRGLREATQRDSIRLLRNRSRSRR